MIGIFEIVQNGSHWPRVLAIRQAFEAMGIFLSDLHRGNLALD